MIDRFGLEDGISLKGVEVVICGFARSGQAAAALATRLGANVTVLDRDTAPGSAERAQQLGVRLVEGREDASDLEGAQLVVASPGIRPDSTWWKAARVAGVPWWSEIELAWRAGIRPVAAVTGTNGKTTTTAMLAACLSASGRASVAAGNIGTPLASCEPGDTVIAEVSSFQLAASQAFGPSVCVLLNIAPDHLDWHGDMDSYIEAKASMFTRIPGEGAAVLHSSVVPLVNTPARPRIFDLQDDTAAAHVAGGNILLDGEPLMPLEDLQRQHVPFVLDAMAAAVAAVELGVPRDAAASALGGFQPEPHRLEEVAEIRDVLWINDSKATDPHAAESALASFYRPVILIAGGLNKGLDLSGLAKSDARLRAVIAIGDAAGEIRSAFAETGIQVLMIDDLRDAVAAAADLAESGDVVLLSPACASFDRFSNYEERGNVFKAAVLEISEES